MWIVSTDRNRVVNTGSLFTLEVHPPSGDRWGVFAYPASGALSTEVATGKTMSEAQHKMIMVALASGEPVFASNGEKMMRFMTTSVKDAENMASDLLAEDFLVDQKRKMGNKR